MSARGLLLRLGFVAVVTWLLAGFTGSFGGALALALIPVAFHEMLRPRR